MGSFLNHRARPVDPFAGVQAATREHQRRHGCGAYTYQDGTLPGVVASVAGVLLAANLTLGPDAAVLTGLNDPALWLTHSFGETAICVKRNNGANRAGDGPD